MKVAFADGVDHLVKQFMQETQMTSDPSNVEEVKMVFELMTTRRSPSCKLA
ncbi:MAG TPA: hypothetical protein VMB46_01960 [Methanomassiliicoccales archaeon]|nr:hypothetical protein [Methanomassiliicoccales archaeon]